MYALTLETGLSVGPRVSGIRYVGPGPSVVFMASAKWMNPPPSPIVSCQSAKKKTEAQSTTHCAPSQLAYP